VADDQAVGVDDLEILELAGLEVVVGHCARVPCPKMEIAV
jgi:hypothetical protein